MPAQPRRDQTHESQASYASVLAACALKLYNLLNKTPDPVNWPQRTPSCLQSPSSNKHIVDYHHTSNIKMVGIKGPTPQEHDGSSLRIGIVHARWNTTIIEPLLKGTLDKLKACGVKESNITVQSVPGSWELPISVQR